MSQGNEVTSQLAQRVSVRSFTDDPVSVVERQAILEAACQAPTAGCQQLYTIIDVRDQAILDQLAVLCDNQPFVANASLALVFCADCAKWPRIFEAAQANPREPGVGDLLLAVSDANIAAQNAVTAAWSLGVGSCYIGDVMERCEQMRDLLHLPKHVFPAAFLVFGHPTTQQLNRPKPARAPMDAIVCVDGYRQVDEELAHRLVSGRVREDERFSEWVSAFCARKYNSDFSREMTRSVGVYLEDFDSSAE